MSFLKKHKGKITALLVIALLLAVTYVWGGNAPGSSVENPPSAEPGAVLGEEKSVILPMTESEKEIPPGELLTEEVQREEAAPADEEAPTTEKSEEPAAAPEDDATAQRLNRYNTEPVPEGKPQPVEPQTAVISDRQLTCTLSVRCDAILNNLSYLDKEKTELVPADGIILSEREVTFYEGESVFNLLLREMKRNKIHFEYVNTPIYNSAYIEGINNIYEFDCGELSGWMYKVNGWFPNYGSSRYQIKEGDKIEWVYTCNLGKDVGRNIN